MSENEPALLNKSLVLDPLTKAHVYQWLEGQYDDATKALVRNLVLENPKEVIDSFFTRLTFGTGGLRGLLGVGTNRMNVYTVRAVTQGLAHYIHKQIFNASHTHAVFIGYDSRHFSREFAEESAKVLAGNDIVVYLFKDIRPTPLLSFACRYKKCSAAIMITASHNPPTYNGYKIYWSDGGQLLPPHDEAIMQEVATITDPSMVKSVSSLSHSRIIEIDSEMDEVYLKRVVHLQHFAFDNQKFGHQLNVVYTSLHGTGITLVPKVLAAWGFTNISLVEKQMIPNGDFPSVSSPNPEEPAALQLGIEQMLLLKADLLIATDPDADRAGIACLHHGKAVVLTGNQIAVLCLEHICAALTIQNSFPQHAAFIKTIGTTELFQAICNHYHRPCVNVLPGFKYIGEKIKDWDAQQKEYQFIFGGEESYGYLLSSTLARDKDALTSSALICEVALQAKRAGKTLLDKLHDLYHQYGIYQEKLLSLNFSATKNGREQLLSTMQRFRNFSFREINGIPIITIEDYLISKRYHLSSNLREALSFPVADILLFWLEDGSKIMIRPSGTEPKLKIYVGVVEKAFTNIEEGVQSCSMRCQALLTWFQQHLLE